MFQPQHQQKPQNEQQPQQPNSSAPVQDTGALQLRAGILQLQKAYGNQRTMQMLSAYRFSQQRPMQLKKGETETTPEQPTNENTAEPQRPAAMYRVRKKGAVRIKLKKLDDKKPFDDTNAKIDQVIIGQERPRGILGDHHGSHTTAWEVFCDVVRFSITGKTVDDAIATLSKLSSSDMSNLPGLPKLPHLQGEGMEEEEKETGEAVEEIPVETETSAEESLPAETVNVEVEEHPAASGSTESAEEEEELEAEGVEQWSYDDLDAEYEPDYLEPEDDDYLESLNPTATEEEEPAEASNNGFEEEPQPAKKEKMIGNTLKRSRDEQEEEEEASKKIKLIDPLEVEKQDKAAENQMMMGNYLKAYRRLSSGIEQADAAMTSMETSGLQKISVLQELVLSFLQFRNSLPLSAFDSAVNNGKSEGKLVNDIRKYENFQDDVSTIKAEEINALRSKMWLLLDQAAVEEFYEQCKEDNPAQGKEQVAQIVKRHLITLNQAYSNVYGLTQIASQTSIVNFLMGKVKPVAKKKNEDSVTLHFDRKTATQIAKLVMNEKDEKTKKTIPSPHLAAKGFSKRDKVDEKDLAPTKRFACQIELNEDDDPVITHIRFSGRAPGIFGNATMGSHLTAWSLHAEVVKTKLRGKTLSQARDELSNLFDGSKSEGGYKRTEALKKKQEFDTPGNTSDDFPDQYPAQEDGIYDDILKRFKSAEEEVSSATAALQEAKGSVMLPSLQDAIAAYMHFRNTMLLSAVDGRNIGLRAVGRGEPAKIRDIRKVERLATQNEEQQQELELDLINKMATEEEATTAREQAEKERHKLPDKDEVRKKMWEMLDHDALDYFTRRDATGKTAPGIWGEETHLDLIDEVLETHLKALREAFPKAYAYAEMGSDASRKEFFSKFLVTHQEGKREDILSILKDVDLALNKLSRVYGGLGAAETVVLCQEYVNAKPLFHKLLSNSKEYEQVLDAAKAPQTTAADNLENAELKDYNIQVLVDQISEIAFAIQDKIQKGSYKRLGQVNQKFLSDTATSIQDDVLLTRKTKIVKKRAKKTISYAEHSDQEDNEEIEEK